MYHGTGREAIKYHIRRSSCLRSRESHILGDCSLFVARGCERIQVASCAMGRLRDRVFDCRDLTVGTKLKVYNQCIIPLMMYGSETWTLYRHHMKPLGTIQQRHLRSIPKIR